MSASDEATLKVKPPQSWHWEQNGTTVVATVMIFEVVDNWSSVVQINVFLKS